MFYRKIKTAFSAAVLGALALLAATAHAQIDLDRAGTREDPIAVVTFSKESLPIPTGTETFYQVRVNAASQNDFNLKLNLGYPVPAGTGTDEGSLAGLGGVAVRFDLLNLEFNQQLNASHLFLQTGAGATIHPDTNNGATQSYAPRRLAYGGTGSPGNDARCPGDTCAIYEIATTDSEGTTAPLDLLADTQVYLLTWNRLLRVSANGDGQVRVRIFRDADAALNPAAINDASGVLVGGLRKDTGWKRAVHVASSVTTIVCPGTIAAGGCGASRTAVSNVAATPRWTNFAPAGTKALGSILISLSTGHWKADGSGRVASLDDVRPANNGGSIIFEDSTQSLAFAAFSMQTNSTCAANLRDQAVWRDVGVMLLEDGDNAGKGVKPLFSGHRHLCATPRANTEIPVTTIGASVSYNSLPNNAFAAAGANGDVGYIVRNGAIAELSYLTVSERYNQRIIITNRSGQDAEYELNKFYTEDGTEGAAGETASGMVPAESSIVVLTREAVTFTGTRSRGSATLAVTAPARMVSAATTQVNLSDGSTDTVNYDVSGEN